MFSSGEWLSLLETSLEASVTGTTARCRRRRGKQDTIQARAARALGLVHMGELSNARQALEGDCLAPGTEKTWKALTDEERRPPGVREPLDPFVAEVDPTVPLNLDIDVLFQSLRNSRRGAAAGPSGMTTEHLKILLDDAAGSSLLGDVATLFGRGQLPEDILTAVRVGRMTALQKPDGGVRGVVVGDVFRRLVARTIAKQFAEQAEGATHPFQYALSTRAGTECVAHIVQALTSMDENATLLSIDGVGAYDSISRRAMFRGLADMVDGEKIIPFVRQFYDSPSTFLLEDDTGDVRRVRQGEGGEQGDPLMPLLWASTGRWWRFRLN